MVFILHKKRIRNIKIHNSFNLRLISLIISSVMISQQFCCVPAVSKSPSGSAKLANICDRIFEHKNGILASSGVSSAVGIILLLLGLKKPKGNKKTNIVQMNYTGSDKGKTGSSSSSNPKTGLVPDAPPTPAAEPQPAEKVVAEIDIAPTPKAEPQPKKETVVVAPEVVTVSVAEQQPNEETVAEIDIAPTPAAELQPEKETAVMPESPPVLVAASPPVPKVDSPPGKLLDSSVADSTVIDVMLKQKIRDFCSQHKGQYNYDKIIELLKFLSRVRCSGDLTKQSCRVVSLAASRLTYCWQISNGVSVNWIADKKSALPREQAAEALKSSFVDGRYDWSNTNFYNLRTFFDRHVRIDTSETSGEKWRFIP